MPVPPSPILVAASRWLTLLPTSGTNRTRTLLTSHTQFGDLTPSQYQAAYEWLETMGLLGSGVPSSDREISAAIFQAAISDSLWLPDADVLIADSSELPADALRAADATGTDPEHAYAIVRQISGKVDTAERALLGAAGELALLALLEPAVRARVRHVAAESDGYGYDIAVEGTGKIVHIELKTTSRHARTKVYLSRNEFETSRRDAEWILTVARLDQEMRIVSLSTVDREWLMLNVPSDRGNMGRWESARLEVPGQAVRAGIPPLSPILKEDPPRVLVAGIL